MKTEKRQVGEWKPYGSCSMYTINVDKIAEESDMRAFESDLEKGLSQDGPFIINLNKVRYLSSATFSALLRAKNTATELADFALAGVRPAVYDAFEITGLHKMFNFYESAYEAAVDFGAINPFDAEDSDASFVSERA